MSHSVTCYATPGKRKALLLCDAFAEGARACGVDADVCTQPPSSLRPGMAAFYGVTPETVHLWREARDLGRDWFFIDNAYFDVARGTHFRVTRNALQATGQERADFPRLEALDLLGRIRPWRQEGGHIVIVEQSDDFMQIFAGRRSKDWLRATVEQLRCFTSRRLVVRAWDRNKRAASASFRACLVDAWALVAHTSAAANEAVLAGVPVFTTGPCAASCMGRSDLSAIGLPAYPWARPAWAAALAGLQWTVDEIRQGLAWQAWQPSDEAVHA